MKKMLVAAIAALALAIPASAAANNTTAYEAIGTENPALQTGASSCSSSSLTNIHNGALRFGSGGRIAIPGQGGTSAEASGGASAVETYSKCGSGGIVNPPVE